MSPNNNPAKTDSPSTPTTPKQEKKKPMIQHLLAGGTAGFVESSVCHPLDTIKTRMQLRRQTTARQSVGRKMEGRALGSLRDPVTTATASAPAANNNHATTVSSSPTGLDGKGALHRSTEKTVVVKPNTVANSPSSMVGSSSLKNSTISSSPSSSPMHDVGWKQRLPPSSAASATTTSAAATTTTTIEATTGAVVATLGPFGTARRIIQREGPLALYKGLTAVYTGIVPKMAIRFVSFEYYRDVLGSWYTSFYQSYPPSSSSGGGTVEAAAAAASAAGQITFVAGLLSGLTEAILVVTPAEVCKIRMQSQYHSLMDPSQKTHMKYKNVVQTAMLVVKEDGLGALYKGVVPTMLRQGCNQAVNFTVYNWSKNKLLAWKKERAVGGGKGGGDEVTLDHWQSLLLGGLSGGMGPLVNNPLDVVKTRMQKQVIRPGTEPKYKSLMQSCVVIAKEEGTLALWKGITPRLMRIMPGQAITFMTYEAVSKQMERYGMF